MIKVQHNPHFGTSIVDTETGRSIEFDQIKMTFDGTNAVCVVFLKGQHVEYLGRPVFAMNDPRTGEPKRVARILYTDGTKFDA